MMNNRHLFAKVQSYFQMFSSCLGYTRGLGKGGKGDERVCGGGHCYWVERERECDEHFV